MKIKELLEHLGTYNGDDEIAYVLWQVEDVLGRAKDRDIAITDEQAAKAIHLVQRRRDCDLGITWTTIDCAIDEVLCR